MNQFPNNEYKIPNGPYSDPVRHENIGESFAFRTMPSAPEIPTFKPEVNSQKPYLVELANISADLDYVREEKILALFNLRQKNTKLIGFVDDMAKFLFKRAISEESHKNHIKNELITSESKIGASIFGLSSEDANNRCDFFYEGKDSHGVDSWFFHQRIQSNDGTPAVRTLHYEALNGGVLLVGKGYISGEELDKFMVATKAYHGLVLRNLYSDCERPDRAA